MDSGGIFRYRGGWIMANGIFFFYYRLEERRKVKSSAYYERKKAARRQLVQAQKSAGVSDQTKSQLAQYGY